MEPVVKIFIYIMYIMYIYLGIILFISFFILLFKKESFKSDYTDYNEIDRINVNNKFAYCIGAKATCQTGVPIKGGVYANGNTYKSQCDDDSNMVCNNSISNLDICGNSFLWKTPNNSPILFSKTYKGFTEPTSYIPAVINNNSINFYDINNRIIDTINKCSILGLDENKCKQSINIPFTFADTKIYRSGNDISFNIYDGNEFNKTSGYITEQTIGSFDNGSYTEKPPKSNGKSGMYPNLPCIADYGTFPGENVCNGEIGLIQDQTLVCPYYKPICSGYRCGSSFGNCDYSK